MISRSEVILIEIVEADFRTSEETMWKTYIKTRKRRRYKADETVLFINKARKICYWVLGEADLTSNGVVVGTVLDTRKWRFESFGTWTSRNIEHYASYVGLRLLIPGRKTVEDVLQAATG